MFLHRAMRLALRLPLLASLLLACLGLAQQAHAQAIKVDSSTVVSVLTFGPGDELYSTFGHTAIRVRIPSQRVDEVFNYGTFDFDTEGFYIKFMRGRLPYKLGVDPYRDVIAFYRYKQRYVVEQVLALSLQQQQAIVDYLLENLKPENRYYPYDFQFDNCSTRPRDVLNQSLNISLAEAYAPEPETFRYLLDPYLQAHPWSDFGIDLLMGSSVDRTATAAERAFLPEEFFHALNAAQLGGQPLVSHVRWILKPLPGTKAPDFTPPAQHVGLTPLFIFGALFLGVLGWLLVRTRRMSADALRSYWGRYIDGPWFILLGLAGLIFFFMAFLTEHAVTKGNINLLWGLPTHLVAGIMLIRKRRPQWLWLYFVATSGLILLWLLLGTAGVQYIHPATLALVLITLLRSSWVAYRLHPRQLARIAQSTPPPHA